MGGNFILDDSAYRRSCFGFQFESWARTIQLKHTVHKYALLADQQRFPTSKRELAGARKAEI
jgi:hypothetical protein